MDNKKLKPTDKNRQYDITFRDLEHEIIAGFRLSIDKNREINIEPDPELGTMFVEIEPVED